MKVVGTNEEVGRFLNALCTNTFSAFCTASTRMPDEHMERIPDGFIGTYCGVKIDVEIVEKPKSIGMIIPHVNYLTNLNYIAKKHGGLLPNQWPPLKIEHWMCKNGTEICCFPMSKNIRGYKFDELWMESLPSNWDEFDLCISSVMGKRDNIHFFKELEKEKETE